MTLISSMTDAQAALGAANTFTAGPQTIQTGAAANKGLVVKGAAAQTANLQEWQDSAGVVNLAVNSAQKLIFGAAATDPILGRIAVGNARISGGTANTVFQVMNDGNTGIDSAFAVLTTTGAVSLGIAGDGRTFITANGAAIIPLVVKGAAAQTANLQEWQDSAAAIQAAITPAGNLKIGANQVVGARGAAVADATGGATVDAEARTAINALLARVRTHGLIA